jgi:hypothetical protein
MLTIGVPDEGWNRLDDTARQKYDAQAAQGEYEIAALAIPLNDEKLPVSDGPQTAVEGYPHGWAGSCPQDGWEHHLRWIIGMDDPCFDGRKRDNA